jgi:hypothetical protein
MSNSIIQFCNYSLLDLISIFTIETGVYTITSDYKTLNLKMTPCRIIYESAAMCERFCHQIIEGGRSLRKDDSPEAGDSRFLFCSRSREKEYAFRLYQTSPKRPADPAER